MVDSGEQQAFSTANASTLSPYLRAASSGTLYGHQHHQLHPGHASVGDAQPAGDRQRSAPCMETRRRGELYPDDRGRTEGAVRHSVRRFRLSQLRQANGPTAARCPTSARTTVCCTPLTSATITAETIPRPASVVEHGWYTTNPADNSGGAGLGEEVWGFVPYHLLPQLRWYHADGLHPCVVCGPQAESDRRPPFHAGSGLWERRDTDTDSSRLHPSGRVGHDLNRRASVRRQLRIVRCRVLEATTALLRYK
mgnify:CR=1 FL=1